MTFPMKTLNIAISDTDFDRLGLKNENLAFSELVELIRRELLRQNLDRSVALAESYGLAEMSMDEITEEIRKVRTRTR